MNKQEITLLHKRAKQIQQESQKFIEKCNSTLQNSKRLHDDTAWLIEKSMVLREEALADKCKSVAIFKLTDSSGTFPGGYERHSSSINDDTLIALHMIEELKQTDIPSTSPLHALRSELLALSFLPLAH